MREIKFRFYSNYLHKFVEPQNDIFVGALKDPDMNPMQYTGLKDKNGVEIYEGDILRIGSSLIEEVKWVGVGDWVGAKQPMVGFISHETIYRKPIEVIGNIYANPELLKD